MKHTIWMAFLYQMFQNRTDLQALNMWANYVANMGSNNVRFRFQHCRVVKLLFGWIIIRIKILLISSNLPSRIPIFDLHMSQGVTRISMRIVKFCFFLCGIRPREFAYNSFFVPALVGDKCRTLRMSAISSLIYLLIIPGVVHEIHNFSNEYGVITKVYINTNVDSIFTIWISRPTNNRVAIIILFPSVANLYIEQI